MFVRIISLLTLSLFIAACNATPSNSLDSGVQAQQAPSGEVRAAPLKEPKPSDDDSVISEIEANEEAAEQEQAATDQETRRREAAFERNVALNKPVGTTVCTWQNSTGVVQKVETDRIQVAVKGRAPSATNGAFFGSDTSKLDVTKQEGNVWTEGSDWAVCDYKM